MLHNKFLNGTESAKLIIAKIAKRIEHRKKQNIRAPGLCTILIGNDEASIIYVRNKRKAAEEIGIESHHFDLPTSTSESELIALINDLNKNPQINGILIQLPLPKGMSILRVNSAIDPMKDVDGFHPDNVGRLSLGEPLFVPCTPKGCLHLLEEAKITLLGAHAVIVGSSNIVGKPLGSLLLLHNSTVTLCNVHTKNLASITRTADILVSAVGKPHLLSREHVKDGAIVLDVGINRQANGKLVGDVNLPEVYDHVSAITPVPGGVGPMTIAALLENTCKAQDLQLGLFD